ncbi:MAG: DUF2267 domain-containing protein [Paracoccaceae bacterium]|nr:DUF2267 domain-containing protein [Paracoccaceae bacterium]
MPWTYRHPQKEWQAFLADVREVLGSPSDNVAYTTTEGVFRAFRRRLTPAQAIAFAQVLPAVPRALFVQDWDLAAPVPWADDATLLNEVRSLRRDHNFASERAVEAVSYALHRAVRIDDLHRTLDRIGPEARTFWHLKGYQRQDLEPGMR